jgi:hypothetical protein
MLMLMWNAMLRRQLEPALSIGEETSGIVRLLDLLQPSKIVRAK